MFKNIIIAVLVVVILNLLVQNKQNVDILVNDFVTTKELVVDGADYVKKTFDKEFSVHEFKVDIDLPSMQIQKEPFTKGSGIKEETFLIEKDLTGE